MFKKEFKILLINPFPNVILVIVGMYVINLGYLNNGLFYFIKLLDDNTKELNKILVGLNTTIVISKTNN